MSNIRLMVLALISSASLAGPASAAMSRIGQVDVDYRRDHDTKRFDLDGPVERLALRAENSNVHCRDVSAKFADGRMHKIFSGELRQGRDVDVDMPGASQTVKRLEFACGSSDRGGTKVTISADIGRYRAEWQRSPNWNRLWAGVFGAAMGGNAAPSYGDRGDRGYRNRGGHGQEDQWQRVGRETFSGRKDSEHTSIGWNGNRVESVALMPEGANARCTRVTAEFGNGRHRDLGLRRNGFLASNKYMVVDLPGETRNLDGLRLRCRSLQGSRVAIGIYVNR